MAPSRLLGSLVCFAPLLLFAPPSLAQQLASHAGESRNQNADSSVFTLGVQSRLVIEDVVVTDRDGKPVTGLPQSAFHITDQGRPQSLRSFEEGHASAAAAPPPVRSPLPPGTFTNQAPGDRDTTSEVLLIDSDRMDLTDQMFLLKQLQHALERTPAGVPVAIFRVADGRPVEIRGMTTDRADLQRAVAECLPVINHQIDSQFQSALDQILTVAAFLEQTPGRKNVLWFSGQFPLLRTDYMEDQAGGVTVDYVARRRVVQQVEEALDEARVTVYPVDVRGVLNVQPGILTGGGTSNTIAGMNPSAVMSRTPVVQGPGSDGVSDSHEQMQQFAEATGGRAFIENNLQEEIEQAFDLGTRAYSLSYVPSPYATDESWHRVRVTVDGGYRLAYRPGYLATWTGMPGGQRQGVRLQDGEKVVVGGSDAVEAGKPIFFTVAVEPGQGDVHAKGRQPLDLTVSVRSEDAAFTHRGGSWRSNLVVSSYVYDTTGKIESGKVQELNTVLSPEKYAAAQDKSISTRQHLDVPRSARYLLVAVRDTETKRVGTFSLSMRAVRSLPPAAAAVPVTQGAASTHAVSSPAAP